MKSKIKTLLLAAAIMLPSVAYAQIENDSPLTKREARKAVGAQRAGLFGSDSDKKPVRKKAPSARPVQKQGDKFNAMRDSVLPHVQTRTFPDTKGYDYRYYAHVTRKHGWYVGVGEPLTEEHTKHLMLYYKLSRKGKSGPWTILQAMNSYGKLNENNNVLPYVDYSSRQAKDWADDISSVCQWETIGDNGMVLQENAYDEEGRLVYSFMPTSVSDNQIVGHFVDKYGMTTTLRDNDDDSPSYIIITLDKNGFESRFDFVDESGYYKRNASGNAFVVVRKYDEKGNVMSDTSCDIMGNPVIDSWGNSSWKAEYDKWGNTMLVAYFDDKGQLMRLPSKKTYDDVFMKYYKRDQWGRELKERFFKFNEDGELVPDTTSLGVHCHVHEYNDKGETTLYRIEGLDKNVLINDNSGAAFSIRAYDDDGNQTLFARYTADSLLVNDDDDDCISRHRFENGRVVESLYYSTTNGRDSVLNFVYTSDGRTKIRKNISEGSINVEEYDDRGNLTEDAYYDLDMNPIERNGYSKKTINYEYRPKWMRTEERYVDAENHPVLHNSCSVQVIVTDSVSNMKEVISYDENMKVIEHNRSHYDDAFEKQLDYQCFTATGEPGRTMLDGDFFYKIKAQRTIKGGIANTVAVNEFDEPSYMMGGDLNYIRYVYYDNVRYDPYYYDEKGDSIVDPSGFKQRHCKAFCVEMLDSTGGAWKQGLRSGDLLLQYGEWTYYSSERWSDLHEDYLCLATINNAPRIKEVAVMRHDPVTRTSRVIPMMFEEGTPQQLGFVYHKILMTPREEERYDSVARAFIEGKGLNMRDYVLSYKMYNDSLDVCVFKPYLVDMKNQNVASKGLLEQVAIVGAKVYSDGKSALYLLGDTISLLDMMKNGERDSLTIYYTNDGRTVRSITMGDENIDAMFSLSSSPDRLYGHLREMAAKIGEEYAASDEQKMQMVDVMLSPREAMEAIGMLMPDQVERKKNGFSAEDMGDYSVKGIGDCMLQRQQKYDLPVESGICLLSILSHIDADGYECYVDDNKNKVFYKVKKGIIKEVAVVCRSGQTVFANCRIKADDYEPDYLLQAFMSLLNDEE